MCLIRRDLLSILVLTVTCWAAVANVAAFASEPSADAGGSAQTWRYKFHNGRWWYWLPSNSWAVYENQRWVAYNANRSMRYSGAPSSSPEQWPHGHTNGSDMNASTHAGGATYQSNRNQRHTPGTQFPYGDNGSDPHASPKAGGHFPSDTSRRYLTLRPNWQQDVDDYYKWRNN